MCSLLVASDIVSRRPVRRIDVGRAQQIELSLADRAARAAAVGNFEQAFAFTFKSHRSQTFRLGERQEGQHHACIDRSDE